MTESTEQSLALSDPEQCWTLLERVAGSVQLRRAARLRELLLYVGRRSLKDGCNQIHEQEIGSKVFGRPDDYDTSVDNIVRANATTLRKRIQAYFDSEGRDETVVIEIPRGSYVPVFRYRRDEPGTATEPAVSATESSDAVPGIQETPTRRRWLRTGPVVAGLIMIALASGCVALWVQNRAMQRSFYPWRYSPSVAAFWSEFLDTNRNTDIIMPDAFFRLAQELGKKPITLNDYLNRSYISALMAQEKDPSTLNVLNKVSSWSSVSPDHLRLARRILALDPLGKSINLHYSSDYMPDFIEQHNVILLGSQFTNPWDSLFDSRLNFTMTLDDNNSSTIMNRAPAAGERKIYTRTDTVGYCIVAYLPNPSGTGKALLIEGTSVEATEAGGDFLLSEGRLSNFQKMLHVTNFPYFEVLLKTSQLKGTPFTAAIEAYRTYPNLR